MHLATRPTCIFGLTYISAHQPEVTCPTTVFICCCALWFYLPRILAEQWCVTSAVSNVGEMRSKHLNEYLRVTVKGNNQTHMNQSSGFKIHSQFALLSFSP